MAFDSMVMRAVISELSEKLAGGRISKIYQPESDELALLIYAGGKNYRLMLSANPRFPRLHLTGVEKKNPAAPPTFCMLLRKYIDGGRILAVRQVGRERICRIHIGVTDELGNPAEFVLAAEVMGKHSNLLLLHPQGRIVDAIRRVTEEVNRYRELLPGLPYVAPPSLEKLDPAAVSAGDLAGGDGPAWQVVLDRVDALGPLLAREAVVRAGCPAGALAGTADPARLAAAVRELAGSSDWDPALLFDPQGRLKDFHALPLQSWPGLRQGGYASVNACLDAFYQQKQQEDRIGALRGSLAKLVRDEAGRVRKKAALQAESLKTAENAEEYRIQGELITSNLWQIKKGDAVARVVNYYVTGESFDPEGAEVEIRLDPAKSPSENAQAMYHRYQKARSGLAMIQAQLAKSHLELAYLEQVEAMLQEAASLPDLEEIRRELQAEGYIGERRDRKAAKTAPREREEKAAPPITVQSTDGLEIWIGRNNRQNDMLTLRLAAPNDLWFHTKEIPGSHVILRAAAGRAVPERAIHEAAALAAWHSKGRESASVPVDYTLRKHVRKPGGARPGMVIYEHQKTLWVTPDPELNPILKRHLEEGSPHGTGAAGSADRSSDQGEA